jgi:hypothetical protein
MTTTTKPLHTFHIPVMGLAYTIDSPIRGKYGISSVISIIDDDLIENECLLQQQFNLPYQEITQKYTIIVQNVLLLIWFGKQNCKEKFENFKTNWPKVNWLWRITLRCYQTNLRLN